MNPSTARLIHEINTTGTLKRWRALIDKTPLGVWELLDVRGLGPKKLRVIWQGLGIETPIALLHACEEGKVAALPGLGLKTEETIKAGLAFKAKHKDMFHYASALPYATKLEALLQQHFPGVLVSLTGAIRRKMEVVGQVDLLIGTDQVQTVTQWLDQRENLQKEPKISGPFSWRGQFVDNQLKLIILFCRPEAFYKQLIIQTGAEAHLALIVQDGKQLGELVEEFGELANEQAFYEQIHLPYMPPELREGKIEFAWAREKNALPLLEVQDLKGVFHSHTTASDGKHTLEEMARHCIALGYVYLGVSDHSRSAIYAGGLMLEAIQQQHQEIDRLNKELAPFNIFKGIESDVLADGSLDYPDEVLASFDFVIASVHTGLQMNEKTATERVIKAICNPYTTILAHLTSRLLLRRQGFPIDYKAVIDACAEHGVIIEINSNPWRLELDWRWVDYALSKNIWISVNPDAHSKEGIENMYYGVCVGRKGGLTPAHTFNALPQPQVATYLQQRKGKALGKK